MAHRITIPDALGGGWVDIKDKRSWMDSNLIAGARTRPRAGLSREDVQAAGGDLAQLVEFDAQSAVAVPVAVAVLAWSDGLIGAHQSMREWLDSDDCDEEVGDFLLQAIEEFYATRRRSKSGADSTEQGIGLNQGADAPSGLRALRDREVGDGVPA